MSILLVIIGIIGWIISVNGWFVVPTLLWKGCLLVGVIILAIQFLAYVVFSHKINKEFRHWF